MPAVVWRLIFFGVNVLSVHGSTPGASGLDYF